jgi:prepilin-type N-terminal cleavage/methylation domain-containing protein
MPTSSVGKVSNRSTAAGVTLIELLVVLALMGIVAGLTFPAITSGIDSLRLNSATNGVVGFFNSGLNRAERRQQVVQITISKADNSLSMQSTEPGFTRKLEIADGVTIEQVLPETQADPNAPRSFLLYPGGTVPPFGVRLINRRGVERVVHVDPMTGVPVVDRLERQ